MKININLNHLIKTNWTKFCCVENAMGHTLEQKHRINNNLNHHKHPSIIPVFQIRAGCRVGSTLKAIQLFENHMILQPVTVTTFDDIFFINTIKITITVLYIWSDEFMIMIIMYLVLSWFCLHKSSFHYINRLCNASSNCTLNAMLNK